MESDITSCADIADLPESGGHGPFDPVTEDDSDLTEGEHEFLQATVEIGPDGELLNVTAEPGHEITAVAVRGEDAPGTNVYFGESLADLSAPDSGGYGQPTTSHYTVCSRPMQGTQTPTPTPTPGAEVDAGGECVGSVPYLAYAAGDDEPIPEDGVTITFVNPDGPNVEIQDQPASGQVLWPGAEVDSEGNGTDWPGWIFEDGSWVEADDGFEWVRPSVTVIFSWNAEVETVVEYPAAGGDCNPPQGEPEENFELTVLQPICDDDVPYLEYVIEPEGFTPTDVSITWINPDGENLVYEDLPLSGRVLWAGAVAGPNGEPLDWPGWVQQEDGTWVEGDDGFEWVRPSVDVLFQVNPEQTVTVGYPPSSPDCAAEPPQNDLPRTGANLTLGMAGGGLVLGGLVLMLIGRRRMRNQG